MIRNHQSQSDKKRPEEHASDIFCQCNLLLLSIYSANFLSYIIYEQSIHFKK